MNRKILIVLIYSLFLTVWGGATYAHSFSSIAYNGSISACDDIIVYTVEKGETVYSIAAAHNITVQQIYELNPNAKNGIKQGEKLKLVKGKLITGYSNHKIESKETLYSVSRLYDVSVEEIKNANPGLNESSFKVGKTIKVPKYSTVSASNSVSKSSYKVLKGETLYSIGLKHNISVEALLLANPMVRDNGLKEGSFLIIPSVQNQVTRTLADVSESKAQTDRAKKSELVRVGMLFPFSDDNGSIQTDKLAEYYEGFLLAVKSLKETGLNAEIYSIDIGPEKDTRRLESLLETNEMKNLDLVIGGVSKQQIDMLAKFSKKYGINYVIPFGSTKEIESNSNIFQMTTSHANLYPEVMRAFVEKFGDYNIIFVSDQGTNDKADFVSELRKELSKSNKRFKTVTVSDNLVQDLSANMTSGKNIIVPASSTEATLRKLLSTLGETNTPSVSLFGYPEWQAYNQHASALHNYDSYIYSIFFLDENQKETVDVNAQFKNWYNKNMINSFPRWAFLGYDTGLFFLTGLMQYGKDFDASLSKINVNTLQSAVNLKPVSSKKGGAINSGIYFVHYKLGSGIEKIDISK